jgi:hypothetical protein
MTASKTVLSENSKRLKSCENFPLTAMTTLDSAQRIECLERKRIEMSS